MHMLVENMGDESTLQDTKSRYRMNAQYQSFIFIIFVLPIVVNLREVD